MSLPCFMSDLPSHVVVEILLRLPIKTIIGCKCVCKNWLKLISDSEFAKLHLSRSSPSSLIINQLHSSVPDDNGVFKIVEVENESNEDLVFDPVMRFNYSSMNTEVFLLGSCDGLLLLNSIYDDSLFICNPILREYISLPQAAGSHSHRSPAAFGFGYSSRSDQYKVVRICQEQSTDQPWGECKSEGQVYSIGSKSWRSVDRTDFCFGSGSAGIQLKEKLHWFIFDPKGQDLICTFDLNDDKFRPIAAPPGLSSEAVGTLGVIGGCLCLNNTSPDYSMELWIMKQYGVKSSWMKKMTISRPDYWLPYVLIYPLTLLRDGKILFLCSNHTLFSSHPDNNKFIKQYDDDVLAHSDFEAMLHIPSFLSLQDYVPQVNKF